jgi:hypothetical protein
LTDWLPFASEKVAVIRSSDIITFVDPSNDIIALYRNGKTELLTEWSFIQMLSKQAIVC